MSNVIAMMVGTATATVPGKSKGGADGAAGRHGATFGDAMNAAANGGHGQTSDQQQYQQNETMLLSLVVPIMPLPVVVADQPLPAGAYEVLVADGASQMMADMTQLPGGAPTAEADFAGILIAAQDDTLMMQVDKTVAVKTDAVQQLLQKHLAEEKAMSVTTVVPSKAEPVVMAVTTQGMQPTLSQGEAQTGAEVAGGLKTAAPRVAAAAAEQQARSTDGQTTQAGFSESANETDFGKGVFAELLQQRTVPSEFKPQAVETARPATQFVKDTYDIAEQIVDQAKVLRNNEQTQMIIRLKPEHLGELTLKIAVDKGIINASFHSDNVEVRTVLESSLQHLKQELAGQGLKIDNVGVYAGLGQFLSNGQREPGYQHAAAKLKNKQLGEEAFEEAEAVMSNQAIGDDGVDYRV